MMTRRLDQREDRRNEGSSSCRRSFLVRSLLAVALLVPAACASTEAVRQEPVTVTEIIALSKERILADEIIRRIHASGTVYPLRASQLSALEREGVQPAVIDFMQLTYLDAVRRDEQYLSNLQYQNDLQYQQYLINLQNQNRIHLENSGYYIAPYGWHGGYFDRYRRR
jgi:hypothetical protein